MALKAPKKSDITLIIPSDTDDLSNNKLIATDEFAEKLDEQNAALLDALAFGNAPDIADLAAAVLEDFRKKELPTYFVDNEEISEFYNIKRQELLVKLMGFLDVSTNYLLDPDRIKRANLKELTGAIKTVVDMVQSLSQDNPNTKKHVHEHKLVDADPNTFDLAHQEAIEELDTKIQGLQSEIAKLSKED